MDIAKTSLRLSLIFSVFLYKTATVHVKETKIERCSNGTSRRLDSTWICPEGVPRLRSRQICDGYVHCRLSLADENNCVRFRNSTNVADAFNSVAAVDVYVPDFWCLAPLCYSEDGNSNEINAHLICRNMNYMTFDRIDSIENDDDLQQSALGRPNFRCLGHESNLQQCFDEVNFDFQTSPRCSKYLGVECKAECQYELRTAEGIITSPGYPNVSLSRLDCTWTLFGEENSVYHLEFWNMNLQEFVVVGGGSEESHENYCGNSYVEMGLGVNASNKRYTKIKKCSTDNVMVKNYTSFGNRVHVRYVSGQYFGPLPGVNGFELRFRNVQLTANSNGIPEPPNVLTPGFVALVVLCTVFGFITISGLITWRINCHRKQMKFKRRTEYCIFRQHCEENNYCTVLLHSNRFAYFQFPLRCPTCGFVSTHVDHLCRHFKRLADELKSEENDKIAKDLLLQRYNVKDCHRDSTRTSNVTVDLDQLFNGLGSCTSAVTIISGGQSITESPNGGQQQQQQTLNDAIEKKPSMISNFLEPLTNIAKKFSASSWHTPSPNKTSTPTEKRQLTPYENLHNSSKSPLNSSSLFSKIDKRLVAELGQCRYQSPPIAFSPLSPTTVADRTHKAWRKLKLPSSNVNNNNTDKANKMNKNILKVNSTGACSRKPPKIVVVPSSVHRQLSTPSIMLRDNRFKGKSQSLQTLTVERPIPSPPITNNTLSPASAATVPVNVATTNCVERDSKAKPESAPAQLENYSKFCSFLGSPSDDSRVFTCRREEESVENFVADTSAPAIQCFPVELVHF